MGPVETATAVATKARATTSLGSLVSASKADISSICRDTEATGQVEVAKCVYEYHTR